MLGPGQPFFPYWVTNLKICNFFFSFPYEWNRNGKAGKLTLLKKRYARILYSFEILLFASYLGAMYLHMILNGRHMTLTELCKGFVGLLAGSLGLTTSLTFFIWKQEGLKMWNGILEYEQNLYKGNKAICVDTVRYG
jgi:hypothetical protein